MLDRHLKSPRYGVKNCFNEAGRYGLLTGELIMFFEVVGLQCLDELQEDLSGSDVNGNVVL